ncbi:MAG: hypothetical protein WCL70_08015 [Paludibacter sp.]
MVVINNKTYKVVESNWKSYKALVSQDGINVPVIRVLNQDEIDYIGDIESSIELNEDNTKSIILTSDGLFKQGLTLIRVALLDGSYLNGGGNTPLQQVFRVDDNIIKFIFGNDGCVDYPIEIKVRQRGTAPVLLSAETNEAGDKVILNFDKRMSAYNLINTIASVNSAYNGEIDGSCIFDSFDDKTIKICPSINISKESSVSLFFDGSVNIESFDYGLLSAFENFPVTNNVI